ncbi:MAG: tRNA lysidine(34) synthetase TilS [Planctomycetaceae bacterium]
MNTEPGIHSSLQNDLQQLLPLLIPGQQPVVVAVSGGTDSMVLLHLLHSLPKFRPRLMVAHLNHGLRAAESDADEELVRQFCGQHQIHLQTKKTTADELNAQSRGSLEESARTMRYEFLLQVAEQASAQVVLTAHHADDQAETLLHNLIRGTGLHGLRGMQPARPLSKTIQLVRPLLGISRTALVEYAAMYRLQSAEDSSNSDPAYTRNRLRHEVLPLLTQIRGTDVSPALLRLADQAAEAIDCLNQQADQLLQQHLLQRSKDSVRLRITDLGGVHDFLLRHALVRLWEQQGWPRQQMSSLHWHRLSSLLRQKGSISFPGGIQAESARGMLILSRPLCE